VTEVITKTETVILDPAMPSTTSSSTLDTTDPVIFFTSTSDPAVFFTSLSSLTREFSLTSNTALPTSDSGLLTLSVGSTTIPYYGASETSSSAEVFGAVSDGISLGSALPTGTGTATPSLPTLSPADTYVENSGNLAMAMGFNDVFKTLQHNSTCNNNAYMKSACIDDTYAVCGDDGFYHGFTACPAGSVCLATPSQNQYGVKIGCTDAAELAAFLNLLPSAVAAAEVPGNATDTESACEPEMPTTVTVTTTSAMVSSMVSVTTQAAVSTMTLTVEPIEAASTTDGITIIPVTTVPATPQSTYS
jgi:hypothetical protein